MKISPALNYRTFLREEYQRRQKKNPSYSMRAFARDLEIPSSRLSEVLNEKIGLSEDRAAKLAEKLNLNLEEKEFFLDLVRSEHARSATAKKMAQARIESRINRLKVLSRDQFNLISDWHHYALLELCLIETNHDVEYLSLRLGLSIEQIKDSLALMERMSLIVHKEGRWIRTDAGLTTTVDIPSEAIQGYNRQILRKAEQSLSRPVAERDYSAVTFSLNKEALALAKDRIGQFRREFMREFESMSDRNAVYCFAIQFFELTESK